MYSGTTHTGRAGETTGVGRPAGRPTRSDPSVWLSTPSTAATAGTAAPGVTGVDRREHRTAAHRRHRGPPPAGCGRGGPSRGSPSLGRPGRGHRHRGSAASPSPR